MCRIECWVAYDLSETCVPVLVMRVVGCLLPDLSVCASELAIKPKASRLQAIRFQEYKNCATKHGCLLGRFVNFAGRFQNRCVL